MDYYSDWSVDQFARHYAETISRPADAWGAHRSPLFGDANWIMVAARKYYDAETVERAFAKAIRENEAAQKEG